MQTKNILFECAHTDVLKTVCRIRWGNGTLQTNVFILFWYFWQKTHGHTQTISWQPRRVQCQSAKLTEQWHREEKCGDTKKRVALKMATWLAPNLNSVHLVGLNMMTTVDFEWINFRSIPIHKLTLRRHVRKVYNNLEIIFPRKKIDFPWSILFYKYSHFNTEFISNHPNRYNCRSATPVWLTSNQKTSQPDIFLPSLEKILELHFSFKNYKFKQTAVFGNSFCTKYTVQISFRQEGDNIRPNNRKKSSSLHFSCRSWVCMLSANKAKSNWPIDFQVRFRN